ncbi:response regulator transcription factor [Conexibacter sp. DBS9H8]|uniref:LuxR C-terminal-related transcriptional regulator n=1 Tax=Conexibacter sp. DBS9H8 TaxID=2937801 RepID=UPI00200E64D8|nr:response regulator transcription factor [Conexibacter sp. DBS9H8]
MRPPAHLIDTRERLRVLVAVADRRARTESITILGQAGIEVVGATTSTTDVVRLARHHRPDIVIVDLGLPEPGLPNLAGMGTLDQLRGDPLVSSRTVLLTARRDPELGVLALRHGALGIVHLDDLRALPRIVADVSAGIAAIPRGLTTHLVHRLRELPEPGIGMRPVQSPLTPREWEVADLLCLGHSTEQLADELVLSAETVRTHVKNIMRKLEVHSRSELIAGVQRLRRNVGAPSDRPLRRSAA